MRYSLVQRGLIALVLVLAMAVWFSASTVVPALASQWHLSAGAAAWLIASVQAGFVLGAVVSCSAWPNSWHPKFARTSGTICCMRFRCTYWS